MPQPVISATGLFTPEDSISNEELVASFNSYVDRFNAANAAQIAAGEIAELAPSSVEFIEKASGIKARYVLSKQPILDPEIMCPRLPERPNEEISVLAEIGVAAARDALARAGRDAGDVDAVLCACSNLQRPYPAIAVEIQDALGIEGFGFDMNVACSSATFGMHVARDMIAGGSARSVLVVSPEICSGHLNFRDRDSHFIFGDVCTAVIVERDEPRERKDSYEILSTRLQTQFSNNIRNNFGFLYRCEDTDLLAEDKLFVQQGRKVFKDVVPMVIKLLGEHLADNKLTPQDLKCLWLHQANIKMNQLIVQKLLGREATQTEAPTILDEYANTASAGSIIAFHKHREHMKVGDLGVICSFGAGYSIGNVLVRKVS